MKLRILESAKQDLIGGYEFYEDQGEGIGGYFLDCLKADITSLRLYAGLHRKQFGEFYWMLSKRFPYAVYYTIEDDIVLVRAVLDCRQNPLHVEARLEGG